MARWTVHHVTLSFADQQVEVDDQDPDAAFEEVLRVVGEIGAKTLRIKNENGKTIWLNPGVVILPPDHAGLLQPEEGP